MQILQRGVSDLLSDAGAVTGSSGFVSVTGKLLRKEAEITLKFGYGKTVDQTFTFNVNVFDGIPCDYTARQWALQKIAVLSSNYEANKTKITELAKKFNIVTKDTSLIVLDSVHDYVHYGIVPPEELKAEYERLTANSSFERPNQKREILTLQLDLIKGTFLVGEVEM